MSFLTAPPEINSLRMFSGAGSGPMLSAAAAWDGLAAELGSAAESFGSVTSGLAGQAWQGPASAAMAAAAVPYAGWLGAAAASASGAAAQARAVAGAFESALAATVHPVVWRPIVLTWCSWWRQTCLGRMRPRLRLPRGSTRRCGLPMWPPWWV